MYLYPPLVHLPQFTASDRNSPQSWGVVKKKTFIRITRVEFEAGVVGTMCCNIETAVRLNSVKLIRFPMTIFIPFPFGAPP